MCCDAAKEYIEFDSDDWLMAVVDMYDVVCWVKIDYCPFCGSELK